MCTVDHKATRATSPMSKSLIPSLLLVYLGTPRTLHQQNQNNSIGFWMRGSQLVGRNTESMSIRRRGAFIIMIILVRPSDSRGARHKPPT